MLADVLNELVSLLSISVEEEEVVALVLFVVGDAVSVRLVVVLSTVVVVGMEAVSDTLDAVTIELICSRGGQLVLLLEVDCSNTPDLAALLQSQQGKSPTHFYPGRRDSTLDLHGESRTR